MKKLISSRFGYIEKMILYRNFVIYIYWYYDDEKYYINIFDIYGNIKCETEMFEPEEPEDIYDIKYLRNTIIESKQIIDYYYMDLFDFDY
jgi:hypothetical protein